MQSAFLQSLAFVASLAMSIQSTAFAVEHTGTELSIGTQHYPGLDDRGGIQEIDGVIDVSLKHGQSLPFLDIQVGGEISISNNDVVKKPWNSNSFESNGKVQLVQYVAATRVAVRQNKAFNDSLIEKKFSSDQLETTVIVHLADTLSLFKGIVVERMAKNKAKHEKICFVIDDNSVGLQRWGMKNKSSAIIVLDAHGNVLFAKDGPLSESEIESTIALIENQMT
jgi:YtfJ family uncharacterized protein